MTNKKAVTLCKATASITLDTSLYPDPELAARRIAKRRADMPKAYRKNYDKAMIGKSLRAATKAFCLECVVWERVEVRLCPSVSCPLWLYRPYKDGPQNTPESSFTGVESKNRKDVDDG